MGTLEKYNSLSEVSKKDLFDFVHEQFLPENEEKKDLSSLFSLVQRNPYISPFEENKGEIKSFDSDKEYYSYKPDTSSFGGASNPSKAKMSFEKLFKLMPGLSDPESDIYKISFIESHFSNVALFREVNMSEKEQVNCLGRDIGHILDMQSMVLMHGDTCLARVICLDPLVIAVYSVDMDLVQFMTYPAYMRESLIEEYDLTLGKYLHAALSYKQSDILKNPDKLLNNVKFLEMEPHIIEFLTDGQNLDHTNEEILKTKQFSKMEYAIFNQIKNKGWQLRSAIPYAFPLGPLWSINSKNLSYADTLSEENYQFALDGLFDKFPEFTDFLELKAEVNEKEVNKEVFDKYFETLNGWYDKMQLNLKSYDQFIDSILESFPKPLSLFLPFLLIGVVSFALFNFSGPIVGALTSIFVFMMIVSQVRKRNVKAARLWINQNFSYKFLRLNRIYIPQFITTVEKRIIVNNENKTYEEVQVLNIIKAQLEQYVEDYG